MLCIHLGWLMEENYAYLGHKTFCYSHRIIFTVFQVLQKFTNLRKKGRKFQIVGYWLRTFYITYKFQDCHHIYKKAYHWTAEDLLALHLRLTQRACLAKSQWHHFQFSKSWRSSLINAHKHSLIKLFRYQDEARHQQFISEQIIGHELVQLAFHWKNQAFNEKPQ